MNNEKIPFGSTVECKEHLVRSQHRARDPKHPERYLKAWRRHKFTKPEPFLGLFIGYRNVQEGYTERDYEEGHYFVPVAYQKVALVVRNSTTNPVYVHLDDIEVI